MKLSKCVGVALLAAAAVVGQAQYVKWTNYSPLINPGDDYGVRILRASDGGSFRISRNAAGALGGGGSSVSHFSAAGTFLWNKSFPEPFGDAKATSDGLVVAGGNVGLVSIRKFDNAGYQKWWNTYPSVVIQPERISLAMSPYGAPTVVATVQENPPSINSLDVIRTNILLLHYTTGGALGWTKTVGQPGVAESAAAVTTDSVGATWISGSQESSLGTDMFLTRINSAGTLLWLSVYNSTPEDANASNDVGLAITVDGNLHGFVGIGPDHLNPFIREYGPYGVVLKTIALPQMYAVQQLIANSDGQVTGFCTLPLHYGIFKLNTARVVRWCTPLPATQGSASLEAGGGAPLHLDVDGVGNSYASYTILSPNRDAAVSKLNDSGQILWTEHEGGTLKDFGFGVVSDAAGNVLSIGTIAGTNVSARVTALDTNGNVVWRNEQNTGLGGASLGAVPGSAYVPEYHPYQVMSPDGSIYYTSQRMSGGVPRGLLTKINPNGTIAWRKNFDPVGQSFGRSFPVEMPNNGVLLVWGPQNVTFPIIFERIDSNGNVLWTYTGGATIEGCVSDNDGNVYAQFDPQLVKISMNGQVVWSKTNASAFDIKFDSLSDSVYLLKQTIQPTFTQLAVQKFSSSGALTWQTNIASLPVPGAGTFGAMLRVTPDGRALTSIEKFSGTTESTWEVACSTLGSVQWQTSLGSATLMPAQNFGINSVAVDSQNNQYVLETLDATIDATNPTTSYSALYKVSPTGQILWLKKFPPTINRVVVSNDVPYVGGSIYLPGSSWVAAVSKLSSSGAPVWPSSGTGVINGYAYFDNGWRDAQLLDSSMPSFLSTHLWSAFSADANGGIYFCGQEVTSKGIRTPTVVKFGSPP